MLTLMQRFHVVYQIRRRAKIEPEFRYIMSLVAEAHPWTDKLLLSFSKAWHTIKPKFRYIMLCSAGLSILSCSVSLYASLAVLTGR